MIDEPKKLVSKNKMSEIVAEFALNEQAKTIVPETDMENVTRFTLKKYGITGNDFTESYKYYTATGDLEKILSNAQKIILTKDPAAKAYIENKLKETQNVPAFAK